MNLFNLIQKSSRPRVLHRTKSRFNDIYVIQNGSMREMWFRGEGKNNFFLQSRIDLERPKRLELVYSQMAMACLLFRPAPRRVFMVGLGAGTIANCLSELFPRTLIDVVEVDREVIEMAQRYFFLAPTKNYRIHEGDGRVFIQTLRNREPCDVVILDAFKSGCIPFHLKTRECYEAVRDILAPDGVVVSNLYGKSNNEYKPRDRKTFTAMFRHTYCFEDPERVATVLMATDQEPARTGEDLRRAARDFPTRGWFSMEEVAAMFRPGIFRDDEAPVFEDDFPGQDLLRAVERNNLDTPRVPPYPIRSAP